MKYFSSSFKYGVLGFKLRLKGCLEEIFGKCSNDEKDIENIFWPSSLKTDIFFSKINMDG